MKTIHAISLLCLLALGCILINGCQSPITNTLTVGNIGTNMVPTIPSTSNNCHCSPQALVAESCHPLPQHIKHLFWGIIICLAACFVFLGMLFVHTIETEATLSKKFAVLEDKLKKLTTPPTADAARLTVPPRDMTDINLSQLENVVSSVNKQDTIVWAVFAAFFAAQGILISVFYQNGGFQTNMALGILLAVFGLGVSWVWSVCQNRALAHLERYDELVGKLETELKIDDKLAMNAKKNTEDYEKFVGHGLGVRKLMPKTCTVFIVIWSLIALACFICFLSQFKK